MSSRLVIDGVARMGVRPREIFPAASTSQLIGIGRSVLLMGMHGISSAVGFISMLGAISASAAPAKGDSPPKPDLTLAAHYETQPTSPKTEWTDDEPKPRECKARFMVGPGMGLVLGAGALVAGSIFTAVGARGILASQNDPLLIGTGSAMLVAGAAAVGYSGFKLSRNMRARREICGAKRTR